MAKRRSEYSSSNSTILTWLGFLTFCILNVFAAHAADVTTQTATPSAPQANTAASELATTLETLAPNTSPQPFVDFDRARAQAADLTGSPGLPPNGVEGLLPPQAQANPNETVSIVPAELPNESLPPPVSATTSGTLNPATTPNNPFATAPNAATTQAPSTFGTPADPAFQNMTKKMYPMSPSQIRALRDLDLKTQRAIAGADPVDTPTPTLSSQSVSLSPGSTPPVIRLSTGYVSSVVFVDETGAPWPVGAYSIGDPESFNIQWDTKSNLLLIQGQKPYSTGNMAVRLQDMPTPVMLTLVTDQQNVDYRIDFRVQGRGPQAHASIIGGSTPQNADTILMNLLEGVPPHGSQPLHVVGGPAQGWLQGNTLYLRTSLTILSPAWIKTMTSADGTKVYQFSATPMILASQGGQPLTLRIEGL